MENLEQFLKKITGKANSIDGKNVGKDGSFIKNKLAKDDKGAWVNYIAEQYLKEEPSEEPPEEFNIISKDIIRELVKREIEKMLGK